MPNYSTLLKVGTENILDGAITTDKLADLSVTVNKLANSCVTTEKLTDSCVTESKLANSAVTTSKLANSAVTAEKISDKSVSSDKLDLDFLIYECSNPIPTSCQSIISFDGLPSGHWIGFVYFAEPANYNTNEMVITISTDLESKSRNYKPYSNLNNLEQYSYVWYFDIKTQDGTLTIETNYDESGIWSVLLIRISGAD